MIYRLGNLTYVKIITDIFLSPQLQFFVGGGRERERIHKINLDFDMWQVHQIRDKSFFRAAFHKAREPAVLHHGLAFSNSVLQCVIELCIRRKFQRPPVGSLFLAEHILRLCFELFVFPLLEYHAVY